MKRAIWVLIISLCFSTSVSDDVEESLGDSLGDTPPLEGHLTGVGKGR